MTRNFVVTNNLHISSVALKVTGSVKIIVESHIVHTKISPKALICFIPMSGMLVAVWRLLH